MKLNKLESIQMNNFLMKKELTSYLDGKNKNQVYKKKYTIFITNFIEDLFNIINQQILTFSQVYESISESQIQHLLNNNKNISYTMILNFYDKIISYFNNSKNKNISRNFSNNNINNKILQILLIDITAIFQNLRKIISKENTKQILIVLKIAHYIIIFPILIILQIFYLYLVQIIQKMIVLIILNKIR